MFVIQLEFAESKVLLHRIHPHTKWAWQNKRVPWMWEFENRARGVLGALEALHPALKGRMTIELVC